MHGRFVFIYQTFVAIVVFIFNVLKVFSVTGSAVLRPDYSAIHTKAIAEIDNRNMMTPTNKATYVVREVG